MSSFSPACASGVYVDGLCSHTAGFARPVAGGMLTYYTSVSVVFGLVGLAVFVLLDVPATITLHLLRDAPVLLATVSRIVRACAVPVVVAAAVNSVSVFLSSQVTAAYDNQLWRSETDNTFVSGAVLVKALRWNFLLHIVPMVTAFVVLGAVAGMHRGMGAANALWTGAASAAILAILAVVYLCTPSSRQVALPVAHGDAVPTQYAPSRPADRASPPSGENNHNPVFEGCGPEFCGPVFGLDKIRIAYATARPWLPVVLLVGGNALLLCVAGYTLCGC